MGISARSSFRASRMMSSLLLMWRVSVMLRVRTSKFVSFSFRVRVFPRRPSLAMSSAILSDSSAHCRHPLLLAKPSTTADWQCQKQIEQGMYPWHPKPPWYRQTSLCTKPGTSYFMRVEAAPVLCLPINEAKDAFWQSTCHK